jgi:CRISPR system Cascade subunit CasE
MAWFIDRVGKWGFEIPATRDGEPDVVLAGRERVTFRKTDSDGRSHDVVLQTATFKGRMKIASPEIARVSLLDGVGPGRAYGCGLITLAPLNGTS